MSVDSFHFRMSAFLILAVSALSLVTATAESDLEPLKASFAKQSTYKTVQVKIKQTKKLPALKNPVINTGYLWLKPKQAFRWQLGEPKAQSAIYDGKKVYLLDEKKKTGKEYSSDHRKVKPLLLILGIGEGASFESMMETFRVTGVTRKGNQYAVGLAPKSGKLKRAIVKLELQVNLKTDYIERIEWEQKDGSVIITEFGKPSLNKDLPQGIFTVKRDAYSW